MMEPKLYDKSGSVFVLDHEHDGKAYVRPLVKVITQYGDGDDLHEDQGFEPAAYLVEMDRSALFDAPPIDALDADIAAKTEELESLKAQSRKAIMEINSDRLTAERALQSAQLQLSEWMKTHKGMMDLGHLLDGKVLYPLSVSKNSYHHARDIPRIPKIKNIINLRVEAGNFEKGKEWRAERYLSDGYSAPFQFFDTEEERTEVILSEFDATCAAFRKTPNFDTTRHTSDTTLHYGTLMEWVKTHPVLAIPDDIKSMKSAHDAESIEKRKAQLAAELAAINAA